MQYIATKLKWLYQSWGKRTWVILSYMNRDWNVEVLKNKNRCRFGRGWDEFIVNNNILPGQRMTFKSNGANKFEVTATN